MIPYSSGSASSSVIVPSGNIAANAFFVIGMAPALGFVFVRPPNTINVSLMCDLSERALNLVTTADKILLLPTPFPELPK